MKISGKLPLTPTADAVLPPATAGRGRFERGRGRGGGGRGEGGRDRGPVQREMPGLRGERARAARGRGQRGMYGGSAAGARERTRNFTRISETNFSGALRSRQAGVVNF